LKRLITTILTILDSKEKLKAALLICLDFIISVLDIAFLGLLLLIINFYTKNSAVSISIFHFEPAKNSLLLIGVFFVVFSFKNWIGYLITKAQNTFFYGIASRLSRQNIWRYLRDDYIKFTHVDSSIHIRKISQQPIEFSNYILTNLQQIIAQGMLILLTIIAILFYHPSLFILLFMLLSPPVIVLAYFIKRKLKHIRAQAKTTYVKTIQHLQEALSGFIESNIYHKNSFFVDRYYSYQQQLNNSIATQQSLQGLSSRLIEIFAVLGFLILIAINKLSTHAPAIDLLSIGVFMGASYKIIPGIVKILNSISQIKTYEFVLDDLLPDDRKEVLSTELPPNINDIKFDNVEFKYNNRPVLNNFGFEIALSDFAGVSGKSGQGKTTLVNLLLGFLKQSKGTISLNHTATTADERKQHWPHIAYVKQQSFFINDSVLKNITLTDDEYNVDKLAEVIAFCGIDALLAQYPEGINKMITENGKNISGGQRQRIMLARALYADFDLLILDEPFSEMDETAEKEMLVQLQALAKKGKMILLITHSSNSLTYCNKIISLDGNAA